MLSRSARRSATLHCTRANYTCGGRAARSLRPAQPFTPRSYTPTTRLTTPVDAAFFTALCQWGASDRVIAEARQRVLDGQRRRPAEGARPVRRRRGDPARGAAARLRRHGCRAQPRGAPDPEVHARLPAAIRSLRWQTTSASTAAAGSSGHGSASATSTRAYATTTTEQLSIDADDPARQRAAGRPIAYLWTRTVPCPNPERPAARRCRSCARPGWRRRRAATSRCARLLTARRSPSPGRSSRPQRQGRSALIPPDSPSAGATTCLACGAAVDYKYVKAEGLAGRMGITPLAAVLVKPSGRGRDYLPAGTYPEPDARAVPRGAR